VRPTARVVGGAYPALGLGQAFALAMLAGVAITLLTWMDHSTESVPARLIAAVSVAFLLAAPPLNHSIVGSLEMFAALHAHASFGYLAWAKVFGWAVLGNAVGGIGLVTVLRLVQVGPDKIQEERVDAAGTSNLVVAGRSPSRPDGSSDGKF
jgi:formate/nitrite transporter FocA (FNT family)